MKRILVTGNAGAGKSTVAARVASILGLPCYSLDIIVWQPGWKKTPREERDRQVLALTEREFWVIDGFSSVVLDAADTVVFLDVPRKTSFWRVAKRNWKYLFRSRPELPQDCPELLIIPTLCKIIWNFPGRIRPGILEQMRRSADKKIQFHLKTKTDLSKFFAALEQRDGWFF